MDLQHTVAPLDLGGAALIVAKDDLHIFLIVCDDMTSHISSTLAPPCGNNHITVHVYDLTKELNDKLYKFGLGIFHSGKTRVVW